MSPILSAALDHLEKNFEDHLENLKTLIRIPSISFPDFDHSKIEESAQAVASLLEQCGLNHVEILRIPGTFPYIYADWIRDSKLPTLLLYAHHDVQPPGREENWHSPPFEPTLRQGPGGMRLYARGSADDKAGIIIHTAAIASYLKTAKELPVNVKILIEGEEEIGSAHLSDFLKKFKNKLQADVIVLTDTANYDCGLPSLTIGLRGLVGLDLEIRALKNTLHSGMWGGPVPDPAMALAKTLATLIDDQGEIAIPSIRAMIPKLSENAAKQLARIPFNTELYREQAGLLQGVSLFSKPSSPLERNWFRPSLSISAIEVSSRKQAGNTINASAWARITLRVAPGMDALKVSAALKEHLRQNVPWGLELDLHEEPCATPWSTDPDAEINKSAFTAALLALEKGYGVKPVYMGCGATIPFVKPFADALHDAPALLIGVEDPYTNAHGENESLLIDDFKKACLAQIHLFNELAENFKK